MDGKAFVCAGHSGAKPVCCGTEQMAALNDFPSRNNISYSFVLLCDKNNNLTKRPQKIIAADLNPIFQNNQKRACNLKIAERIPNVFFIPSAFAPFIVSIANNVL